MCGWKEETLPAQFISPKLLDHIRIYGKMAAQTDRGVPLSTLAPKFLHTNSTSHTWPFSAIAELIDNAYDPDVNAKQLWIDKTVVKGQECLSFMDNGNGLDTRLMHKMLSFGYSDKTTIKGVNPIGMYGNGFKSGSMRLGKDAIVFSKSEKESCVGMLSQTYLEKIGSDQITVPIVCFELKEKGNFGIREEHKASLQDILKHSPFNKPGELHAEINAITSNGSTSKTGTRIIIWNLRRTSTGTTEFDFERDRYDIRIPSDILEAQNEGQRPDKTTSHMPECSYSLRAYCSVLYLKPRMQIIVRGQKVKSQLIAKSLAYVRKDHYKPTFLARRVPITFGYNTKSKDQYGIMMYHKNRLIKAYERVGCQQRANNKGVGVIGIIECYFLEPTHNKQSFNETDKYRKTIMNLGTKLEEYWNEIRYTRNKDHPNNAVPVEDAIKRPDQNWAQCDDCQKWRKLPDGIDPDKLPDKWYCRLNPDPQFRNCSVEQEPVDSDDEQQPSYCKTYKQQLKEDRRTQEFERPKALEAKIRQELAKQKLKPLQVANGALPTLIPQNGRRTSVLPSSVSVSPASSPLRSSPVSQAACSSASTSGPVISAVCSLSGAVSKEFRKRTQGTPQTTPKRPKMNGTPRLVALKPKNSPADNDDTDINDDDDANDDIVIVENHSTPKPQKKGFDLTEVKTEEEEQCMLFQCNDDAAVGEASETNAAEMSSAGSSAVSAALPTMMASCTTQTAVFRVKEERDEQHQTEGEKRAEQSSGVNVVMQHREDGPSCSNVCDERDPRLTNLQGQQDKLVELMQATALERDTFKDQVHQLTCQLQDVQSRLQEASQVNVKKECSHQVSQTEETKDYKALFEKAKQKISDLLKGNEVLLANLETEPSDADEEGMDEIALQVGNLIKDLDERNRERDALRSQLDSLEEERANLASQCEELRLSLQQQRDNAQQGSTTPHTASESQPTVQATASSDSSLIELRHNVGRLLVPLVPALDLSQVNYECNVIDEILEQVLANEDINRRIPG